GAISLTESWCGPRAVPMNCARHEFLPNTALSEQQNGGVCGSGPLQRFKHLSQPGAVAHDLVLRFHRELQLAVLLAQLAQLPAFCDSYEHAFARERLLDEVECSEPRRLHGVRDRAMTGDH